MKYLQLRAIILAQILFGFSIMQAARDPLPLPGDFDYEAYLIGKEVDGKVYHSPRRSARFCEDLLRNGTEEDIANVGKIIPGVLKAQITDPESPYFGAFKWELEMEAVEDLNAVQFLLFSLVPMLIQYEEILPEETAALMRESIRIGLINIANIDVNFEYTNIVLKDITNTILGGELLGEEQMAQRGYDKLEGWIAFTDESGTVFEYNSLPYTAVALDVLNRLQTLTNNEKVRTQARILLSRIGLSAGLHIHGPTGRWAGPHSRAYHGSVTGEYGGYRLERLEKDSYDMWVETGQIPAWLGLLTREEVLPDEVIETSGVHRGVGQSTYKTNHYAFGVASRNASNQNIRYIAWQSNVFTLHYTRPGETIPGSLYTRYILDDHWLGDFSPGEGRGSSGLIPDYGHFQGVQDKDRAIGLYCQTGLGGIEYHSSAKAVVALPRWNGNKDAVWIGSNRVGQLPAPVPLGTTVVLESGDIMMAIKPLTLTKLGQGEQIRLRVMEDDTLVLEMDNYRGPRKIFWELAWPGAFYQGQPQCGFYSEVANRSAYADGAEFAKVVESGTVRDMADPKATYTGKESRIWQVEYERNGRKLGLQVDLYDWFRPARRWNGNGELGWPMLKSSRAEQSKKGRIEVDGVTLKTRKGQTAWLYVSPSGETVAAAYHGSEPSAFDLQLEEGSVQLDSLKMGLVVWEKRGVSLETIGLKGEPRVVGNSIRE
ncbi:MAG: hypothetical protein F7O42_09465 [Opitutae bacterium]|nr:hypothetical protein [Opitutae bacterium]